MAKRIKDIKQLKVGDYLKVKNSKEFAGADFFYGKISKIKKKRGEYEDYSIWCNFWLDVYINIHKDKNKSYGSSKKGYVRFPNRNIKLYLLSAKEFGKETENRLVIEAL